MTPTLPNPFDVLLNWGRKVRPFSFMTAARALERRGWRVICGRGKARTAEPDLILTQRIFSVLVPEGKLIPVVQPSGEVRYRVAGGKW